MKHAWPDRRSTACVLLVFGSLLFARPLLAQQHAAMRGPVGLRDPIAIGLTVGTSNGLSADLQVGRMDNVAGAIEGYVGASVASWGISLGWSAALRADVVASDDGKNDAMILGPTLGYGEMLTIGGPRSYIDFSPFHDVQAIFLLLGVAWVHEFSSGWSTEISLRPGEALALNGEDKNRSLAKGEYSFQLSLVGLIRF
ncbi:MAG: hypothetical protein Q8922_00290 [Bacteroidota bacterium]|nr:hypothetical protein [Bacteroidota bacterium]MDP4232472.1 hypothetical protein [Bacteroidota bacterium]MDP4241608.1 hypothetical protein [Bacteroidota bacterium]MDP4286352.1 hypothetical protein [Bacteroidota bacterium]